MAAKTLKHARQSLASESVLKDMLSILSNLRTPFPAKAETWPPEGNATTSDTTAAVPTDQPSETEHLLIDGRSLPRVTCASLKKRHKEMLGSGLMWQVDEWFDESCAFRNTGYLRYVAVR